MLTLEGQQEEKRSQASRGYTRGDIIVDIDTGPNADEGVSEEIKSLLQAALAERHVRGDIIIRQRRTVPPNQDSEVQQLRQNLENLAQQQAWRPDPLEPFAFAATILLPFEHLSKIVLKRELDTGCRDNWISMESVKRAGLEGKMVLYNGEETFKPFGEAFAPDGTIDITWYATNTGKSRQNTFFVSDRVPCDLILGKTFILTESVFTFDNPTMMLRSTRLAECKCLYGGSLKDYADRSS